MLTAGQIESYRRDGVLCVRGVVGGDELARLRSAADLVMAEAVAHGAELDAERALEVSEAHGFRDWDDIDELNYLYARGPQGERVWRRAEAMWERDPIFRSVTANPRLLGIVRDLTGEDVVPVNDSMVVKMPGAGAAVPWHRDTGSDALIERVGDASSDFTCDVYLDPSTRENGCLRALPGSHRRPDVPADPLDFELEGSVCLEVAPGDLLVHSTGVLHGSPTNGSPGLRRTYYLHYRPVSVVDEWARGFGRPADWGATQARRLEEFSRERASTGLDAT